MSKIICLALIIFTQFAMAKSNTTWGILQDLDQYKIIANEFKDYLKKNHNHDLKVKLFKTEPQNPLQEIENNELQIYQVTTDLLYFLKENKHQELRIWDIPFLFQNKEHVENYINANRTQLALTKLETNKYLPITYSYAGGFIATLAAKDNQINHVKDLKFCKFKTEKEFQSSLPCNALIYELNEIENYSKNIQKQIHINMTNHKVVARVTFVSKSFLNSFSQDEQKQILGKLKSLLDSERQIIYKKAEANYQLMKKNQYVSISNWDAKYKNQIKKDFLKENNFSHPKLIDELGFIANIERTLRSNYVSKN